MTYEEARSAVEALFDAACPGWQAAEALKAFEDAVRTDQREEAAGVGLPAPEQVASRLLRMEISAGDWHGTRTLPGDREVMDWARTVAGRFPEVQHMLWDCGLIEDWDHVYRCFTVHHEGPGTRGLGREQDRAAERQRAAHAEYMAMYGGMRRDENQ